MPDPSIVSRHYATESLTAAIHAGLCALGKCPESVTFDDLGPVEEFHIGGRIATRHFLALMNISENDHVLDAGCGLGGASRFAACHYGGDVQGIDLTADHIKTGNELCQWQ